MQLRGILFLSLCLISLNLFAQDSTATKIHLEDVSIDFLFNYYEQDGIHSPVTGGQGTEKLTNTAPSIIVNIPLDTKRSLSYSGGFDYYTSASSDNINNPYLYADHVSSASANDIRVYSNLGFKQKNKDKKTSYGVNMGLSFEFDVASVSIGSSYSKQSRDENKEFSIKGSYYFDSWKLIYPIEHRNASVSPLNSDQRHSINLSMVESWVMNKRMTASVNLDLVSQMGLLSTPFHRVYLNNNTDALDSKIELLPSFRFKVPLGFRYNYYIADFLLLNAYYRFYWDSWNVIGNTVQIDLPIKVKNFMRIYPFYRFHHQLAAKYFAPYAQHTVTDAFYTSDFDLSGFASHKFGLGLGFSPLYGIFHFKSKNEKRNNMLKSIDLRYAHYIRNDGLRANIYSIAFSYLIKR
ncbi:MAG: DUF3570 domain-containing protein [Chitinophagales bacterium]|nr:DUF3570 domain-containing protein [Chitinophagales bacterium]